MVKHLPVMRETRVRFLGREDPLEKEMAIHSSTLAWKNPMDGGAWQATVHGVAKSRTPLSDFTFTFKWYYKIIFPKSYLPLTLWKITPFIPKMKFLFKNSENLSSWLVFCLLIIRLFKIQVLRGLLMHAD